MNQKISVNITTRNRANLLPRCIESAIAQSYADTEINVIDDASTDSTDRVLEAFKKADPRVRVFRNDSRSGNAASRNLLLRRSTGNLIAFLDDDDYWIDRDKLAKQADRILQRSEDHPIIACTGVVFETPEGLSPHSYRFPHNVVSPILRGNGFIFNSTVMTTKRTFELTNGFDERLKRGVDSEFFRTSIIDHHAEVEFTPEVTTVCRVFGNRMTTSKSLSDRRDTALAHLHILRKHHRVFLKHPLSLIIRSLRLVAALAKP